MSMLLDIFLIAALVVMLFYCMRLHKKINTIRDSKKEFAFLFANFENTIQKADKSIENLKGASEDSRQILQPMVGRAGMLINDLNLLLQRAEVVAEKMQIAITPRRSEAGYKDQKLSLINHKNEAFTSASYNASKYDNVVRLPGKKRERPPLGKEKRDTLEKLLKTIAVKKKEELSDKTGIQTEGEEELSLKNDKTIASMLKALGYGESSDG